MVANKIQYDEKYENKSEIDIKIEAPTATLIPNKIFENTRATIEDIGIQGFAILLILAKKEFCFEQESPCNISDMSADICLDEEITRKYCSRMARKGYIKMDGDFIQL